MNKDKYQYKARGCHTGPTKVLDHKGLVIGGASIREAEQDFYDFDLVISLAYCNPKPIKDSNIFSQGLQYIIGSGGAKFSKTEHLNVKWPDFGIPQLDKEFWYKLAKFLMKKGYDRNRYDNKYKVMVHCQGGHGRTGTALAILCALCDKETFYNSKIVSIIRRKHCFHSVESNSQLDYIEKMLGIILDKPKPSKTITHHTKSNNHSGIDTSSLFKKYDIEDFSIGGHTSSKNDLCNKVDHLFDMAQMGYCAGCGDMTKEYVDRINNAIVKDSIEKGEIRPTNSGIGRSITQEDLDRRNKK